MTSLHSISLHIQYQEHRRHPSGWQCLFFKISLRKVGRYCLFHYCCPCSFLVGSADSLSMRINTFYFLSQLLVLHLYLFIHNLRTDLTSTHLFPSENLFICPTDLVIWTKLKHREQSHINFLPSFLPWFLEEKLFQHCLWTLFDWLLHFWLVLGYSSEKIFPLL